MQQSLVASKLQSIVTVLAATLLYSMAGHAQTQPASPPSTPAASREITDELGRTIRIPQQVRRIVSLAPSLTETLYAIGLQDLLVGDTDYCDYPPDAQRKPKVGGVINPSLEAIVALHPDLVLVTKSLNRLDTVNGLAGLGIPSYATDPHNIAEIISSTQRLARMLGAQDAADAVIKDVDRRLADTQQRLAPFPQRRVLFVVWPNPLISIGKDTFIADALLHAGAVSIVDSSQNWPQISLEDVARQQPEFLVFAASHENGPPPDIESLAKLPGWRILDAVRDHHYVLVSDAVNRPSLRMVSAIVDLARQLHPEAFPAESEKPAKDESDKSNAQPANTSQPAPAPPASSSLPSNSLLTLLAGLTNLAAAQERPCAL